MMNVKISYKDDSVHYMTKNYVLKPTYNDENECFNDTLSHLVTNLSTSR